MKLKVYLIIVLVFLLGMLSGGLIVVQYVESKLENLTTSSTREVYERIVKRLDSKLDLSDSQQAKISAILEGAADEIEPLRTEIRTKFFALLKTNSSKIAAELNTEQQKEFQEFVLSIIERLNLEEDLK